HRAIEPVQVPGHAEGELGEALACGDVQGAERLRFVSLAAPADPPHPRARRVLYPAVMQVTVEARLVDRGEGTEPHRDRREFPELGHEPRVRIARESLAPNDLPPEVIELRLGEPALDERARVDARRGVPREA